MTLGSGQVFHWEKAGGGFVGTIGQYAVYAEQDDDILKVRFGGTPKPTRETRVLPRIAAHYFALDHPLAEICESFPNDPVMNAARDFCRGLRIIRQPKWECLATFICSSMKQVAHIRQISLALRNRFGDQRKIGSRAVHTFPSPQRIARASESQLRESSSMLPDSDLRKNLCQLPGVGVKIANCVMLFAYERLRAFPIDVWIERVLRQHYFPRRKKMTAQQLREFSETYFGEHGGYAQQYLFHHARITSRKTEVSRDSSTPKAFGARNDRLAQVVSPAGLR